MQCRSAYGISIRFQPACLESRSLGSPIPSSAAPVRPQGFGPPGSQPKVQKRKGKGFKPRTEFKEDEPLNRMTEQERQAGTGTDAVSFTRHPLDKSKFLMLCYVRSAQNVRRYVIVGSQRRGRSRSGKSSSTKYPR